MSITAKEVSDHPFTKSVIRRHANKLIQKGFVDRQDRDSLIQEILTRFLQCWCKFDEDFGHHKSFVCTIVSRVASNIAREQASRAKAKGTVSLSCIISTPGEGPTELAATIGEDELDRRLERKPRMSSVDRVALAHDLKIVLETLTPDQIALVERLKSQTLAVISVELGIPRSTLTSRLAVIREKFREAGLQEYLQS
ncbi:MAG: hypothetical protein SGI77_20590 [Pirellulaceae bacterium]|nr:hypothetical protein [Pirellulaceae bacterium]